MRMTLRERVRIFLEELYWRFYELIHPELRCYNKCFDDCYAGECEALNALYKLKVIDIEEWGIKHTNCISRCERECTEKCFS